MSDKETHWKEWKASGGLRGRSQMSDKPWNPEVERIRKAMMERFSDKLSMEEIAEFAYSFAVECTAPAPQPANGFPDSDWKWWFDLTAEGRLIMIRRFRAGILPGEGTSEQASPTPEK